MYKINTFYNQDCMPALRDMPDHYIDLAIVDPPYGLFGNKNKKASPKDLIDTEGKIHQWDFKPSTEYFTQLFRISKNQIIWGANNFTLPETPYFVVWNKQQPLKNFASAEYAWTNCKIPAKVFTYSINKVQADRKSEGGKIHPTQKPVALYEWLLNNYAMQPNP